MNRPPISRGRLLLLAVLGLSAGGAAGWWYWHTSRPDYRVRQAQRALRLGDFGTAETAADSLKRDGHTNEALLLRGEAMLLRGEARNRKEDVVSALKLLNQIDGTSPCNTEAICLSGRCMLRLGNLLEAERSFAFVLTEDPDFLDAHRGLMAVYYDLGAHGDAQEHAERWAELAPRDGRPKRFIGLLCKDHGDCRQAIAAYRAALDRDLTEGVRQEVIIELAECHIKLTEWDAALEVLASSKPPANLLARVETARAECARARGNAREARELVTSALAADPNHTAALRLRAQVAMDAGDVGQAVDDLERAAALAPAEFETMHLLGRAYGQLGQSDHALRAQERVKEIQGHFDELTRLTREATERPKDARLHQKMAAIYAQLRMPEMEAAQRRVAAHLSELVPP
jgi:tetratricopeptide (TPR) repeat protein